MYLGTNQALEIARSRRADEIALAKNYHRGRVARQRSSQRSTWARLTHPVRRSD